jgi:hypothetical protein
MNAEVSIRDYLNEISKRDLDGRYVYPQPDIERRLAKEIQKKAGFKMAKQSLLSHDGELNPKQPVSADPNKFVDSTLAALDEQVAALKQVSPKEFEVGFKNLGKTDANNWGDQISFRIRFTTGSQGS